MTGNSTGQVRVPLADLRATPDDSAELVSQALLGTPLKVLEEQTSREGGDWLHVRLPDYKGWMHTAAIARPSARETAGPQVRIAALRAALRLLGPTGRPGDATLTAYAGTTLPVEGDSATDELSRVDMPDGQAALVDPTVLAPRDPAYRGTPAAVIATARLFLGTPYLWGGMTR